MEEHLSALHDPVILSLGSVIGRDHVAFFKNNQDSYATWTSGDFGCGVVCDGCGSGARSEVGASLTAALLIKNIQMFLWGDFIPLKAAELSVAKTLQSMRRIISEFGRGNLDLGDVTRDHSQFVRTHMLATVVMFCWNKDDGAILQIGDGSFAVGTDVFQADENNAPNYLAYEVLQDPGLSASKPRKFRSREFSRSDVSCVAVATDGFDVDLIPAAMDIADNNKMQRWMNVQRNLGRFRDDATIITARW